MKDLIHRAKSGDPEAFVSLMEAHKQGLYKVARSYFRCGMDAEDAVSQTVLDCWAKLHTLRKPAYFKTWLTKVLINNCNDILRQRANLVPMDDLLDWDWAEDGHDALYFKEALSRLSPALRITMHLYYGEGFNTREIGEILGIPTGTVTARLKRGREALAALGKEEME